MSDQPLYPPPARPGEPPELVAPAPSGAPLTPPSVTSGPPGDGSPGDRPGTSADRSTPEVAKDQAGAVAAEAKEAAGEVVQTAKEQVGEVAQEAATQVRQMMGQVRSELAEQAQNQQAKVAAGLRELGEQLTAMVHGSDRPGMATEVAQQAADKAQQYAGWLENRDPHGVLDEVRSFARRKPGVFLVAALGAGVAAGRLTRGMTADVPPTPSSAGSARPVPAAAPVPAVAPIPNASPAAVPATAAPDLPGARGQDAVGGGW